jgi:CDP-diacylglycerol---glycerol-3-phosphate 3-phosphatidyltransferase
MADRPAVTSTSLATLPNLLGVVRIAATPVVIALALQETPGAGLAAGIVFALAAGTDVLDGRIARARGQVTPLGVFLDLAADKVLVAGALVVLVEVGMLSSWVAAVILVREFVVQAVRQMAAGEDVVIAARGWGKAKTLLTNTGILLLLLARDAVAGGPLSAVGVGLVLVGGVVMLLAVAVTVFSGWLYLRSAWPILVGSPRA